MTETLGPARSARPGKVLFIPPLVLLVLTLTLMVLSPNSAWLLWVALVAIVIMALTYQTKTRVLRPEGWGLLTRRVSPLLGSLVFFLIVATITLVTLLSQTAPLNEALPEAMTVGIGGILAVWGWLWLLGNPKRK